MSRVFFFFSTTSSGMSPNAATLGRCVGTGWLYISNLAPGFWLVNSKLENRMVITRQLKPILHPLGLNLQKKKRRRRRTSEPEASGSFELSLFCCRASRALTHSKTLPHRFKPIRFPGGNMSAHMRGGCRQSTTGNRDEKRRVRRGRCGDWGGGGGGAPVC